MIEFIYVSGVLAYFILIAYTFAMAFDDCESLINPWSFACFFLCAIAGTVFVIAGSMEEERGPCIHYETQLYWNASAKAMMPARVCTQRAEWVKP
ncbi:hypothetical protein AH02_52 [Pseudomonas phage AH02]|nr:hypothetical protein AH02_52 [Pseudomonas phage AH02]